MDFSRYRDKAYLVTYELTTDIFESFGVKVDDIVPVRSVYIIYTDRGVKILKKIDYSLEEFEFIVSVVNHVYDNGYKYVVPFMKTIDDKYYFKKENGIYVMLDLVEGREADFQNPIEVSMISKALAKFHKAAEGVPYILDCRNKLLSWIPEFKKRASDLLKFKEIAEIHEIKSDFDKLFLEYVDRYYDDAVKSYMLLKASKYEEYCSEASRQKAICHHDLAYHNIIIDNENNIYFLDFDCCIHDLRLHDIANLIVKAIKYCNWDAEKAESIINGYSGISELKEEELQILYGFLTFPQDFYEVSRQYYMKTKNWDEEDFIARLDRKAKYYDDRKVFLDSMKDIFKIYVGLKTL